MLLLPLFEILIATMLTKDVKTNTPSGSGSIDSVSNGSGMLVKEAAMEV